MNIRERTARSQDPARALRSSTGSDEDAPVENSLLHREVARLRALCSQHETALCGLTQAMWQLRQEALATQSLAELRRGAQPSEEVEDSGEEISLMAEHHRVGVPPTRSGPLSSGVLAAWAIAARDGRPR